MKSSLLLLFVLTFGSSNAFACKLSPIGASGLIVTAAINEYTTALASTPDVSITRIDTTNDYVQILATSNGQNLKTVYRVIINPNCSTTVLAVKVRGNKNGN